MFDSPPPSPLYLNPNINAFVLQVTKELVNMNLNTRRVNNLTLQQRCDTKEVVYLFSYTCTAVYIGKSIQTLRKRMSQHLYATEVGCMKSPIGKHIAQQHHSDASGVRFRVLQHIREPIRGGDWDRSILKCEARWIYFLRACHPQDLMIVLALNLSYINLNALYWLF